MGQKSGPAKEPAEQVTKEIRRVTRRQFSAEEKIRIVLSGLRGEDSIAAGRWRRCWFSVYGSRKARDMLSRSGLVTYWKKVLSEVLMYTSAGIPGVGSKSGISLWISAESSRTRTI